MTVDGESIGPLSKTSCQGPVGRLRDNHGLIEYMIAVRKNHHRRTSPGAQISTNHSDSEKIGLLKVDVDGSMCFELFLTKEACEDQATVEYLARVIRDTVGSVRIVMPCNLRIIKLFRSGRFKRAAGRGFDMLLYDSTGTMVKLRFR